MDYPYIENQSQPNKGIKHFEEQKTDLSSWNELNSIQPSPHPTA